MANPRWRHCTHCDVMWHAEGRWSKCWLCARFGRLVRYWKGIPQVCDMPDPLSSDA